jgi:hypothetical protein
VNSAKWLESISRTIVLENMLALAPPHVARLVRELRIQNAKLKRILGEKHPAFRDGTIKQIQAGTASRKKARKTEGQHMELVGQQTRKVNLLVEKSFKAWLRKTNPKLTNAEFREWRTKFDSAIEIGVQNLMRQVREFKKPPAQDKPFGRLGSPS